MANLEISKAKRLDQRVVELIPQLSRAFGTKLIEDGKVTVNGQPQLKPGYKLREGDKVAVDFDLRQLDQIPEIKLEVLYEDDDCVVINKPAGVLTHSKGQFNPEATVETWLRAYTMRSAKHSGLSAMQGGGEQRTEPYEKYGEGAAESATQQRAKRGVRVSSSAAEQDASAWMIGRARAGIVHRLDRATSGVLICAKTPEALRWLQRQFSQRRTKKTYYAVVVGQMKEPEAIIDMPLERNPKAPATFRVHANGKHAVTAYKVIEASEAFTLLELNPETGRTHQLRVHLSHLGHPIVGDTLYGGPEAKRMMLHAYRLELTLPNRERKVFTVPVPKSFKAALHE
jgi:23S rRNA pseudouridine1911/1915/1917 synthase